MMDRDNFRAAFGAILQNDEAGARRYLAEQQVRDFGQKDWTPAIPTADATGQKIVFKDSRGYRYTVSHVRPDGSHVRTLFEATQPVQSVTVEAHALTWDAADTLMAVALALLDGEKRHVGGGRRGSFYVVQYRVARPSLD